MTECDYFGWNLWRKIVIVFLTSCFSKKIVFIRLCNCINYPSCSKRKCLKVTLLGNHFCYVLELLILLKVLTAGKWR